MTNWFIWRTDYGKLAYGELENGETISYHSNSSPMPLAGLEPASVTSRHSLEASNYEIHTVPTVLKYDHNLSSQAFICLTLFALLWVQMRPG